MSKPQVLIMDVDGVLTDGSFYYSVDGKVMKKFGADDNDALSLLQPYLECIFVTGDRRGFEISKKRIVDDMHMRLELVSTIKLIDWIKKRYYTKDFIYMGYSISTNNGDDNAKKYADYVTKRNGGDRAVAEACLHILDRFFETFNPDKLPEDNINSRRDWTV